MFLVPGMFGFGKLAGYDYFEHVEAALQERFAARGEFLALHVAPTPPTASIRRRARVLAESVFEATKDDDGPIHILGHSTGGLDARLVASPTSHLGLSELQMAWMDRLQSVTTLNSPHYGTPLATFFTSVAGTRLLYALSLLTFTTLRYGSPPLTIFSSLVAAFGSMDEALGLDVKLLDRATSLLLRFMSDEGRDEVRDWLDGIRRDQGGIVQITPEAMDVFNAATENPAGVRFGCVVSASPPPITMRFISRVRSPYAALSATVYSTLYTVTSREHPNYPCPRPDWEVRKRLEDAIVQKVDSAACDGIVPTRSMIWGDLVWCGAADHLDVMGHFHDDERPATHTDWLHSGSHYVRRDFAEMVDRIADFMLS